MYSEFKLFYIFLSLKNKLLMTLVRISRTFKLEFVLRGLK